MTVANAAAGSDVREALLGLLRSEGVLWAGPEQPVVDRRGRSAPWMFYSWNLSLTANGGALAARCLLERLETFGATQLATYGTTGIPLLTACVLLGDGKYTGICVREQPKGASGGRQIEGPADRSRPVVLVDDSLSSGTSLLSGIRVLERHGFDVEGAISLVHFPGRGGRERAEALGYRVETVFDIWDDLKMSRPAHVPGFRRVGELEYAAQAVDDGLSPGEVARQVAEHLFRTGSVLRPPRRLHAEHDGSGGVWVSFRHRRTDVRVARDGFWHFDAGDADTCRDVVLATVKTIRAGGLRSEQLDELKIAVTFFGRLEPIRPAGLDFSRYGIVVRSTAWPVKVGGALPNTQVFTSEREQLDLALRNAQVGEFEPHELYRHTVVKHVEPGEEWLPYGAPDSPAHAWTRDPAIGRALTDRAREAALAAARGQRVPSTPMPAVPVRVKSVGVTLYRRGVVGCAVSSRSSLDEAVVAAARAAVRDTRFTRITADALDEIHPAVSVLYDEEWVGWTSAQKAARKLRLGRDSLIVQQGDRSAVFLESVGPHYDWDKEKVAQRLLRKAGAIDGPAHWTTYRTATWLQGEHGVVPHAFGFAGPPAGTCDIAALGRDLALVGAYIDVNVLPSGVPLYAQTPVPGWRWEHGTAARVVHGLAGLLAAGDRLGRADWAERAREGLRRCLAAVDVPPGTLRLDGHRCGPMADCTLLAASASAACGDDNARTLDALAGRVLAMLRPDGSIHPDGQQVRIDRDNDYLPNAAMLALAAHAPDTLAARLEPHRAWQLRRFRCLHRWGQAGWLPQACAEVFRATGDLAYAATAFEVADWCLTHQVEATGAFLTDLAPGGPTFHTAFVAEGIADAWEVALACDEQERARRYGAAWWSAMRFARQLIVQPADVPCLADPDRAVGGVRGSLTSSTIRIDYVSHLAIALAKGLGLAEAGACRARA